MIRGARGLGVLVVAILGLASCVTPVSRGPSLPELPRDLPWLLRIVPGQGPGIWAVLSEDLGLEPSLARRVDRLWVHPGAQEALVIQAEGAFPGGLASFGLQSRGYTRHGTHGNWLMAPGQDHAIRVIGGQGLVLVRPGPEGSLDQVIDWWIAEPREAPDRWGPWSDVDFLAYRMIRLPLPLPLPLDGLEIRGRELAGPEGQGPDIALAVTVRASPPADPATLRSLVRLALAQGLRSLEIPPDQWPTLDFQVVEQTLVLPELVLQDRWWHGIWQRIFDLEEGSNR